MSNMFDPPGWTGTPDGVVDAGSLVAAATRALDVDDDPRAGRYWLELAYRTAQSAGDPHGMAVAALGLGGLWARLAAEAGGQAGGENAEPPGLTAACVRDGRQWRIELAGREVLVGHAVGMLHLAVLLANPGIDVPAVELAAGVAALGSRDARAGLSAQPTLDRKAVQEYRQRLADLREEVEELESAGRFDRAAELRAQRDWLTAELAGGAGLQGRTRRFPDSQERARLAVGRAIRRAIDRIDHVDPAIGAHLRRRVHTGVRCAYQPSRATIPARTH